MLTTMLCYLVLAQAWNILAGYGGLISLGVSAFAGGGAYCVALLASHTGAGLPLTLGAAPLLGALAALALSVPLLRLRGDYFTIGTLAAALALQAWVYNWDFAGGSVGLSVPIARSPDLAQTYLLACGAATLAVGAAYWTAYSTFGMRLRAVRDNEEAAAGLGVPTVRYRLAAFVLCGALSGLAGGLIAYQQIAFEPGGMLGPGWSINALLMCVVGGVGTVAGPVVGTLVVYYLLTTLLAGYDAVSLVVEGLLLVLIVRFAPQGIWPLATRYAGTLLVRMRRTA
ncbi:branched-chain amino acid ABC transporter permease [Thermocatellispora tengchongensis]|uniref:branched-chain amino acid ABC transporter permease n=1 Tax=Thermocatellispora tengchongensis TaxID=1073253 RepID=UPI00362535CF